MSQRTGVSGSWNPPALACAIALGGFAALGACRPPFPRELFVIGADRGYPVMLSQTPGHPGGRKIEAYSGIHASQSTTSYRVGGFNHTDTLVVSSQSELSASDKLSMQVESADKWVQIDGAELHAENFLLYAAFYIFSSADRELTIQGTAYP